MNVGGADRIIYPSCMDSIWDGKPVPSRYLHKQLDRTELFELTDQAAYNPPATRMNNFLSTFLLTGDAQEGAATAICADRVSAECAIVLSIQSPA